MGRSINVWSLRDGEAGWVHDFLQTFGSVRRSGYATDCTNETIAFNLPLA